MANCKQKGLQSLGAVVFDCSNSCFEAEKTTKDLISAQISAVGCRKEGYRKRVYFDFEGKCLAFLPFYFMACSSYFRACLG